MWRKALLGIAVLAAILASGAQAPAQWMDPFARLECGVRPKCPFDCDSVTLWVSGELTSTNWKIPVLMGWDHAGDSITVRYDVVFNTGPGLPVLVPFKVDVPIGMLPQGTYRVVHVFYLDNPIATMPLIPTRIITDKFTVAPPGDENCDDVVDVRDVVGLIDVVFRGGLAPEPDRRGDLNCDDATNVLDVISLIGHTFRGGTVCHTCPPHDTVLVGVWSWVQSVGGIAGITRTPKTEGYTQTYIYRRDGIFELYRDSTLTAKTSYTVGYENPPGFPSGLVVRYGDPALMPQLIALPVSDTLQLTDLCMDCFVSTFSRER